ncbi:down syndrome cell adhesion molecule [Trichonephila inaurata madagascariensis]|uniref:Down syndrome cell adhesion molecule n=1 Tax=Trichonephila inaurata madagascariensis TaxID=2747483 RepID=A0A8X6MGX0_9ARAC|nr:down syndrome cell adhesion molecule [Trichonephila inaurata madagascariensis]
MSQWCLDIECGLTVPQSAFQRLVSYGKSLFTLKAAVEISHTFILTHVLHRFNNGTLVLSDVEESDAGSYLCQASNGIAAGLSKIITLQVLVPPTFKEPFQTKTVTEESNTTLRCIATGHAPIVITWQKDKSLIDISKRGR